MRGGTRRSLSCCKHSATRPSRTVVVSGTGLAVFSGHSGATEACRGQQSCIDGGVLSSIGQSIKHVSSKHSSQAEQHQLPGSLRTSEPSRRLVGWPLFRGGTGQALTIQPANQGGPSAAFRGLSPAACPSLLVAWAMKRMKSRS